VTTEQRHRDVVTPKGRETTRSLLDAGEVLAERGGLAGLSVSGVTAQAGVAKGTFYVHFADRASFVDALRARFTSRIREAVLAAVAEHPPGREFLVSAVEGYLDVCLAHRSLKALVLEARSDGPGVPQFPLASQFEDLVGESLRTLGLTPVAVNTRLLIALVSEVATLELQVGERDGAARAALRAWLPQARAVSSGGSTSASARGQAFGRSIGFSP
jgi:AcrR family transcriptional regulator